MTMLGEGHGNDQAPPSEDGDGRNIDRGLAVLEGEASEQAVPRHRVGTEGSAPFELWERVPSEGGAGREPTYYERPAIKGPVWIWTVPAYFYAGGAAGAAAVLAGVAQAADREGLSGLVTRARWVAAVGGAVGTVLLIADLGRPKRFLNMLRVFRPSSPLSVGSWVLAAAGPLTAGSAALAGAAGRLRAVGDAAGYGAAMVGMPLSGYTAVLLSNTAVPVWQEARRTLPPLFVASAIAAASDLLEMTKLDRRESGIVHIFGLTGKIGELVGTFALRRDASRVDGVARALQEGTGAGLIRVATALTAGSLALSVWPSKTKPLRIAGALLGTAGSIALKFGIVKAGEASAADPRATSRHQRAGHGGAEVAGVAAVDAAKRRRGPHR